MRALAETISPERARAVFGDTRWLVVAGDAVCADALACSLRDLGAKVRLIDPAGLALGRLGAFDAQFLLTERGQDLRFLRERVAAHPILRWAAPLSLSWSELWRPGVPTPHLGRLAQAALPTLDPERTLLKAVRHPGARHEVAIDRLGPVRVLRLLCGERDVFRLRVASAHERGEIELAGDLVVGASFEIPGFPPLTGVPAFARTIELVTVRATVERRVQLSAPSLSMPFEEGLELALRDIRERDGSDSPTLRMASPLALLETETSGVSEDEIPTLLRASDSPLTPRPTVREKRDSGVVLGRSSELPPPLPARAPQASVPTDAEARRPVPSRPVMLPTPRDSLVPTAQTQRPRAVTTRAQWIGLSVTAIAITLMVMVGAERLWHSASATPSAAPVEAGAPRVAAPPPPLPKPVPKVLPGPAPRVTSAPRVTAAPSPPSAHAEPVPADLDASHVEKSVRRALSAGDAREAVRWAERLVELKPERARVRVLYGDALLAAGRRDDALAQYHMAEDRAPRSRLVRGRLARFGRSP